jgi:hypothetical protein
MSAFALDPTRDQAERWAASSAMAVESANRQLAQCARDVINHFRGDHQPVYAQGVIDVVERFTGKKLDEIPVYDHDEIQAIGRAAGEAAAAEWDAAHGK